MYDLSILIPARNEQFVADTVRDILKNKRAKTEIIVGLDGEWPQAELPDHDDVRIIKVSQSIGQRGMQNKLAKLSTAHYVAKVDAHCAFDEGFDVKLLDAFKETGDNVTMVPLMKNLHAFDWKCAKCGLRWYQGPTPTHCENSDCDGTKFGQKLVFKPRHRTPNSTSYRFDNMLHFQYFNEWKAKQQRDLVESMSLQGSFFMTERQRYWDLELCDESWGSWGQQGSEVAIKTWLSGGQVICNKRTWYAHLFRTQPGFSFPYPQSGKSQQKARDICNQVFKGNKWSQQVYPLSWLVEKFWPVPGWTQADLDALKAVPLKSLNPNPTKGILYFTDNELPDKYLIPCQNAVREIAESKGYELVCSSRKPIENMGVNVVVDEPRGYLTMFKQILKGLQTLKSDVVFMAEHDVLYPPEHFDYTPANPNQFCYDQNWWKVREDGLAVHWDAEQVSGLVAYREVLIKYYQHRVDTFDKDKFDRKFEPYIDNQAVTWKATKPHIDIRHNSNLTFNKWKLDHFRNKETAINFEESNIDHIPDWPNLRELING